jgi:hypothetical protein
MLKTFNYNELVSKINDIKIDLQGDEVVTYFAGREISRKRVSDRYEIFDFKPFTIKCIDSILKNYPIYNYSLSVVGGRQEIRLFSEPISINGENFYKAFYLINSSDKSRALNFSYGLKHKDFNFISKKNSIYKKHYKGITEYTNENVDINDETFQEEIEILKEIIGQKIMLRDAQKIITESEVFKDGKKSLQNNFISFINKLYIDSKGLIDDNDRKKLYISPFSYNNKIENILENGDISIDSFLVFKTYLKLFTTRDSSIIKRESERIKKLTIKGKRTKVLEEILEF